jgi:predicted nuclease with TOPRIM domain
MYIREDLESYKLEYSILQSRYEKLKQENRKLKDDIIMLNADKEVLNNVNLLIESFNQESFDKACESIRKRHNLSILIGM